MLRFTATFLVLALSGCASIMSGSNDQITLNSSPNGANFLITDENGKKVHHGSTPTTVSLERSDGFFDGQTYNIDFSAKGYLPTTQIVNTHLNGWYFGNLAFGGLLGFLVIDPATGAMFELPDNVNATLAPIQE